MATPKFCKGDTVRIAGLYRVGVGEIVGVSEGDTSEYLVKIKDVVIMRVDEKNLVKVG
ncbi:MAG: hypothetical protein WC375_08765 [Methanomassiliicoccales archaeon]